MREEKTVRQWFEEYLPEDIRKKAIANVNGCRHDLYLEMNAKNFRDALICAFKFSDTEEGYRYWVDVLDVYTNTPYFFDPVDPFKI